jgi:DNA-binding transcriptional LysR family regulator
MIWCRIHHIGSAHNADKRKESTYKFGNVDIIGCSVDTELARTFLAIIAAGNFISAAERLHVTQSTVSARIKALEEQLGCILFVRNKAGTALTPEGRRFQKHALTLTRTVEAARHDVGVPRGFRAALTIAARIGLWEDLLLDWLPVMGARMPDVAIRAEIGFEADLMQGLIDGRIDIGAMYTPQARPGLIVEPFFNETLILVAATIDATSDNSYVYIDWGPEFYANHAASFPDFVGASLTANVGWLGLQHILRNGGSGYFPERMVRGQVATARMTKVDGAPQFTMPAYLIYPKAHDADLFDPILSSMRETAQAKEGA